MSYQSINNNPFQQQSQSPNYEESDNDEEAAHNIKFTIPPNSNEKGEQIELRLKILKVIYFRTILCCRDFAFRSPLEPYSRPRLIFSANLQVSYKSFKVITVR